MSARRDIEPIPIVVIFCAEYQHGSVVPLSARMLLRGLRRKTGRDLLTKRYLTGDNGYMHIDPLRDGELEHLSVLTVTPISAKRCNASEINLVLTGGMMQILVGAAGERASCLDAPLATNRHNASIGRLPPSVSSERGAVDLNAIGLVTAVFSRDLPASGKGMSAVAHTDCDSLQALDTDAERQATNST
jgi:hypothetical protein